MQTVDAASDIREAPLRRGRRLPTLYIPVAASGRLAWMLAVMHGLAVTVVLFVAIPLVAKIVLIAAIVAGGIRSVRRHALLLVASACTAIRLRAPGRCEIFRRDGTSLEGQILGGSYVLTGMIILRLRCNGSRRTTGVILMPDAVAPDAMRRLRVRLRWADDVSDRKLARDLSL